MNNVIDFYEWKRARRVRGRKPTRHRALSRQSTGRNPTSIGELSAELLRLLSE